MTTVVGFSTRTPSMEDKIAALRADPGSIPEIFTRATEFTPRLRTETLKRWTTADPQFLQEAFIILLKETALNDPHYIQATLQHLSTPVKNALTDLFVNVAGKNQEILTKKIKELLTSNEFSLEQKKEIYDALIASIDSSERLKLAQQLPQGSHVKFVLLTFATTLLFVKAFQSSGNTRLALLAPTIAGEAFIVGSCLDLQTATNALETTTKAAASTGKALYEGTVTTAKFLWKHKKTVGCVAGVAALAFGFFKGYTRFIKPSPNLLQPPAPPQPQATPNPLPQIERETTLREDIACYFSNKLEWVVKTVETEYQLPSPIEAIKSLWPKKDFATWFMEGLTAND